MEATSSNRPVDLIIAWVFFPWDTYWQFVLCKLFVTKQVSNLAHEKFTTMQKKGSKYLQIAPG